LPAPGIVAVNAGQATVNRFFTWPSALLAVCVGSQALAADANMPPVPGERLSEWVLRVHGPHADTTSLHWHSRAERQLQAHLLQQITATLESSPHITLTDVQRFQLADWLRQRPVTGRLTLGQHTPRALQAVPGQDPVLREGDAFVLYPRSSYVVVLGVQAQACLLRHRPGAVLLDYLVACQSQQPEMAEVDQAWIAQPDGRTESVGVAPWSLTPQPQPGPGAWIWAPARSSGISHALSDNIARFLATQAPPDEHASAWLAGQEAVPVSPASAFASATHAAPTSNDWGEFGYLQTPSARFAQAGHARASISQVKPYTRLNVMLQPLDWFEFGFRYTSTSNRLYGPDIAGDQAHKDKSIDARLRLREESAYGPAIALGLRDLGGTGLFSSEYLVASKRWGNWDASVGLGWGNMGSRGNIRNPLSLLGSRFESRPRPATATGGTANVNALFRGPVAVFGGVQWASPSTPWIVKAELDGNSYQNEPLDNNQQVRSPINLGAAYRYSPSTTLSLGWQRGNTLMLGLAFQGQLDQTHTPKALDPAAPAFTPQAPTSLPPRGWADVASEIERHTGWVVQSVVQSHGKALVNAETDGALFLQQRIDRVIRLMHALAPQGIATFQVQLSRRGLPLTQVSVNRHEWVLQNSSPWPSASALPIQTVYQTSPGGAADDTVWQRPRQGLQFSWTPSYHQTIGGPDGFILYQLGVALNAEWALNDHTWVEGRLRLGIIDNYHKFTFDAPSELPRVRTYAREFATTSRLTLPRLQLTHVRHLGGNHYGSVYGGLLESMYAGLGAEWLYRPHHSPWAFGIDVNHVRQRGFSQHFNLRDYRVSTGHATLHWDTGWNDVQVKVQAGRYLAGDAGVTLDLSRSFKNGVSIGAWATQTNVSAAQFGEGSFDKGIYLTIPFDSMLPLSTPDFARLEWNPLTRDGGARLRRAHQLFNLTAERNPRALRWRSAGPARPRSAQNTAYTLQEPPLQPLQGFGARGVTLARQLGDIPASTWLVAGGAVLASSMLDRRTDRWAQSRQSSQWDQVGTAASATPYLLAAGTGVLASGVAGPSLAATAQTSLYAGAYTIAASMAVRGITGRARPVQGQGASQFAGPSGSSFESGFVSNHTALAFALVTPFAQQHNMPWLYGLAATTALGRVQQREHWLSDTVGATILGVGIGTLLSIQQTRQQTWAARPRVHMGRDSVMAHWTF